MSHVTLLFLTHLTAVHIVLHRTPFLKSELQLLSKCAVSESDW